MAKATATTRTVPALLPGHYMLLQRNLLYTAITRARRLCVLVDARWIIAMAAENDMIAARHTALAERLGDAAWIGDTG